MTEFIYILLLSLVPTFDGRYAIIYGIGRGYPLWDTLLAAFLGVLILSLILPFALPLIDVLMLKLKLKRTFLQKFADLYLGYIERVRKKARPYIERWGFIGLAIFVAIPLPGTGVWTGSLAAYIFGMEKRKTIPALLIGGLLSILITLMPSLGIVRMI